MYLCAKRTNDSWNVPTIRGGFANPLFPCHGGSFKCYYCGKENCDTKICPEVMEDIRGGKIRRNAGNQIIMFDGMRIPIPFENHTMREFVNTHCDRNRATAPPPVDHMMVEVVPNALPSQSNVYSPYEATEEEAESLIQYHQESIDKLRARNRKYKFDGVVIPARPTRGNLYRPPAPQSREDLDQSVTPPLAPNPMTVEATAKPANESSNQVAPVAAKTGDKPLIHANEGPVHPYAMVCPVTDAHLPNFRPYAPFRGVEARVPEPLTIPRAIAITSSAEDCVFQ